jgi:homocysteine S-methyltransferase
MGMTSIPTNPDAAGVPRLTAAALPCLGGDLWVTDGGLETTLVFLEGVDLVDFAAFPLLDTESGRSVLARYYRPYLELARSLGAGVVVDTPTWRASLDWGARLGYDPVELESLNRRAVRFVAELVAERAGVTAALNGVIGPRGDGYVVGSTMSVAEAANYHALQARAFAAADADLVTAVTMTSAAEAIGIVRAVTAVGLPVVVSFTVETDGRLPSGEALGDAIDAVDAADVGAPLHYMINCAHPTHFDAVLAAGGEWVERIGGVRANASSMSHAELDQAAELDRGSPAELAEQYRRLRGLLPGLAVVGGCCGTDHEHVTAIADALSAGG